MGYGTVRGAQVHQVCREDVGYAWQTTDPGPAVVTPNGTRITVSRALWQAIEHVMDSARDDLAVEVSPVPVRTGFEVTPTGETDLTIPLLDEDLDSVQLSTVGAQRTGKVSSASFVAELEDLLRGV